MPERSPPKHYWPIIVLWNSIILIIFLAMPYRLKMVACLGICIPFAAHLVARWRQRHPNPGPLFLCGRPPEDWGPPPSNVGGPAKPE